MFANIIFVKLGVTEAWLLHFTTGMKRHAHGAFGRTSLLEGLRDTVAKYFDGEAACSSAVAEQDHSEDHNPMLDVDQDADDVESSPGKIKSQGGKRMRYFRNLARNSIVIADVLVRCTEENPECTEVRPIRLYIADPKRFGSTWTMWSGQCGTFTHNTC